MDMDIEAKKAELKEILHIAEKQERLDHIKEQMKDPDFWLDHEKAGKLSQEMKHLEDIIVTFELAETETDLGDLENEAVFTGVHDDASCYLTVHAGSGGTEAMDWAGMLLRMYLRYCEKTDFKAQLLEETPGEEAGMKSALISIKGFRAYGKLKGEGGVHRLVRMSPFDADKARHTSFASVEVVPEIEKTDLEIKPDELKIDVYRSGGHGGQGVNTTDSAVRITHLPTGIVVTCQNERSQLQNKAQAMKVLEAKLQIIEEDKRRAAETKLKGQAVTASWGNQIRSYVLAPYQLIKDLRTGYETSDTQGVLDGEIDLLLDSYGKWAAKQVR
jgi:peptide chain release factor 2